MNIESVNNITNNTQAFLNKYIHVKCYICYNQDIQALHHVPTLDQPAYPVFQYNSSISFDYKNISNCSHTELQDISMDMTIVIVSGTISPIKKGDIYPCPYKMFVKEVNIYNK